MFKSELFLYFIHNNLSNVSESSLEALARTWLHIAANSCSLKGVIAFLSRRDPKNLGALTDLVLMSVSLVFERGGPASSVDNPERIQFGYEPPRHPLLAGAGTLLPVHDD